MIISRESNKQIHDTPYKELILPKFIEHLNINQFGCKQIVIRRQGKKLYLLSHNKSIDDELCLKVPNMVHYFIASQ
jgi:hypothetical protein